MVFQRQHKQDCVSLSGSWHCTDSHEIKGFYSFDDYCCCSLYPCSILQFNICPSKKKSGPVGPSCCLQASHEKLQLQFIRSFSLCACLSTWSSWHMVHVLNCTLSSVHISNSAYSYGVVACEGNQIGWCRVKPRTYVPVPWMWNASARGNFCFT